MNPLLNVRENISSNRKELEHEQAEFRQFNQEIDPILKKLQSTPENKQGFVARYFYTAPSSVKIINAAVAQRKEMETLEVKLTLLAEEIDKFKPDSGPLAFLELNREFQSLHRRIVECRINIVANVIKCDTSAAAQLGALEEQYKGELTAIKSKLDALEDLYFKVNDDYSGQYQLTSEVEQAPNLVQARVQELHEHLLANYNDENGKPLNLRQALSGAAEDIAKARQKIRGAKTFQELEQCNIDLLNRYQAYDKAVVAFIHTQRGDPFVQAMLEEIDVQVTARGKEIKELKANSSIARPVSKNWEAKQWGLLLTPTDKKETMSAFLGQGFRSTVNGLKEIKHRLKNELKAATPGSPEYQRVEKELQETNRALYHTILTRSLDVISEKEWEIRQPGIDPMKKEALGYDLIKLNMKFDRLIDKYNALKQNELSLMEGVKEETKSALKHLATLGFYNGKLSSAAELLAKKQYADMGYSMMNYLPQWLSSNSVPAGAANRVAFLNRQLSDFHKWAEKHPSKAALMASDISLTIMLLTGSEDMVKEFNTQMESRAYVNAFVAPFGGPAWEEVEMEDELKYRALADLARYTPALAGAGYGFAKEIMSMKLSPWSLVTETVKGAVRGAFVQSTADLVPKEAEQIAKTIGDVVAGKSFRDILETQRNIELVRLGGIAKAAIINPTGLFNSIKRNFEAWKLTLKLSPPLEKFTRIFVQIVVPTVAVLGGIGLVAFAIAGGPATMGLALGLAAAAFLFGGSVTWRSNSILNTIFPLTQMAANKQLDNEVKATAKAELFSKHKEKIKEIRENYIRDLQSARQLPFIRAPKKLQVTTEERLMADRIVKNMQDEILGKLKKNSTDPAGDLNANFKTSEVIAEAMKAINQDPVLQKMRQFDKNNLAGDIAFRVAKGLVDGWLTRQLDERLVERAVTETTTEEPAKDEAAFRKAIMKKTDVLITTGLLQNDKLKLNPARAQAATRHFDGMWNDNRTMIGIIDGG